MSKVLCYVQTVGISIHAPREGRDGVVYDSNRLSQAFQSTRPARGATANIGEQAVLNKISIHAPREGRDTGFHQSLC